MNRAPVTTERSSRAKVGSIALWVLQILLAALFLFSGSAKLFGEAQAVQLFDDVGAGQWLRHLTGLLEVAGGIGLPIPRLCGLAALGLIAVMGGALVTDAFIVDGGPFRPLVPMLGLAVVAWFRRDRTLALLDQLRGRRTAG